MCYVLHTRNREEKVLHFLATVTVCLKLESLFHFWTTYQGHVYHTKNKCWFRSLYNVKTMETSPFYRFKYNNDDVMQYGCKWLKHLSNFLEAFNDIDDEDNDDDDVDTPDPLSHSLSVCVTSKESQRSAESLDTNREPRYRACGPVPLYSSSLCSVPLAMTGFLIWSRSSAWESRSVSKLDLISARLNSTWCLVLFSPGHKKDKQYSQQTGLRTEKRTTQKGSVKDTSSTKSCAWVT